MNGVLAWLQSHLSEGPQPAFMPSYNANSSNAKDIELPSLKAQQPQGSAYPLNPQTIQPVVQLIKQMLSARTGMPSAPAAPSMPNMPAVRPNAPADPTAGLPPHLARRALSIPDTNSLSPSGLPPQIEAMLSANNPQMTQSGVAPQMTDSPLPSTPLAWNPSGNVQSSMVGPDLPQGGSGLAQQSPHHNKLSSILRAILGVQ